MAIISDENYVGKLSVLSWICRDFAILVINYVVYV